MSFKDIVAEDIHKVFLNPAEFADLRTVCYDGMVYTDIPVSLQELEETDRKRVAASGAGGARKDSAAGLYQADSVLYCALTDLCGVLPEQGKSLQVNDREGGDGWFQAYSIVSSRCEMGMLRIELRAVGE